MKRSIKPVLFPSAAVAALVLSLVYAQGSDAPNAAAPEPVATVIPEARVVRVRPAHHRGELTAFGQARSRFEVTLAAQVSGRVTNVATEADSGFIVDGERVLITIEDIQYRMAVADARRALADAELTQLQERRQSERAREEWEAAELDEAPSDLALRVPQLAAADAAIGSARASLANARNNLRLTRIRAPFSAVLVERLVGPGAVVQPGTPLLRIASVDRAEIRVPLSAAQWSTIDSESGAPVTIIGPDSMEQWEGYVLRVEQHVGRDDRQRALVVALDEPMAAAQPLRSGTFVSVTLPTQDIGDAYRLPATALDPNGRVWRVDADGRAMPFEIASTISLNDEVVVQPRTPLGEIDVLVRPLANLTEGTRVKPIPLYQALLGRTTP
ncbi:MAG: efflux RND transporter periplasmic adaptor subunit [Pseudomonadota bacterium]